jgi:hypothetical protein
VCGGGDDVWCRVDLGTGEGVATHAGRVCDCAGVCGYDGFADEFGEQVWAEESGAREEVAKGYYEVRWCFGFWVEED